MQRGQVFDYVPMEHQGFVRMNSGVVYGFDDRELISRDKTISDGDAVWVDIVDGRITQMWRI